MLQNRNFITQLHQSTPRDYLARMLDDKVYCMKIAKQYGDLYWDGERRYGYGGYKYQPGRWKPVALSLIENYKLTAGSSILDVGCGKGFLLHEMKIIQPNLRILGLDISKYALKNAKEEVMPALSYGNAQDLNAFEENSFDLVISLGTLHNLRLPELKIALQGIERIGCEKYIMMESYRTEAELFNLQCWALTAETFLDEQEWIWLFDEYGYSGDYEFIFFE